MARARTRTRRIWPLLAGVAVAALCLAAFFELAEDFRISSAIAKFDSSVTAAVHAWRTPELTRVFMLVTSIANGATMWLLVAVVSLGLYAFRHRAEAIALAGTVGAGALLGALAKNLYVRTRPPSGNALIALPTSYSFPSGHALASLLFFGMFGVLVGYAVKCGWPRVLTAVVAAVVIVLVGLSRVYLGVHWPSDVIASWLFGGAWLSLCAGAYASWRRRR
ncbi:MAG: phosphatase PAP2 family protein [Coriobacteriia bacterium]|nr:phosphatase PAP2 family protein [Coriobacteriia bacterium]